MFKVLTHWGRVTHTCVGNLTVIGPNNGLSPGRRQAIIWTNARILLIEPLGTNFIDILSQIQIFSYNKMHLKMSSGKCRPSCLGLNVLNDVLKCHWVQLERWLHMVPCCWWGVLSWRPSLGLVNRYPFIWLCHCSLFEHRVHSSLINGYLIFKSVAGTGQELQGTTWT